MSKKLFNFILTGGLEGDPIFGESLAEIIKYNAFANKWIPVGELKQGRAFHATSVLPLSMVEGFCSH